MLRVHRILQSTAVAALSVVLLSCGSAHTSDEYFILVSNNLQLPYWKTAGTGFSNAAAQYKGVRFDFVGGKHQFLFAPGLEISAARKPDGAAHLSAKKNLLFVIQQVLTGCWVLA